MDVIREVLNRSHTPMSDPAPPPNYQIFRALMLLTTNSDDKIALDALRKANKILADLGQDWGKLLDRRVTMSNTSPFGGSGLGAKATGVTYSDAQEIEAYFDTLQHSVSPGSSFADYVDSVYTQWQQRGYLTQKQYDAIKRSANRSRS